MEDPERRYASSPVELRNEADDSRIAGYALKFDRMSQDLGGWVERIAPTALNKTLADGADVLARFQHEDHYLLGRTTSGTLRLLADQTGLWYDVDLPDTDYARNLAALAARGDVRHSSFAFWIVRDEWSTTGDDYPLRTLQEVKLVDVAPVVQPAYLDTSSGLRTLAQARQVPLEQIQQMAQQRQLSALIRRESVEQKEPVSEPVDSHSLALRRRRLALMARTQFPSR